MSDKPVLQPDWFRCIQRSPWAITILAVGAVLTALAAWTQAIDTLRIFTGIKPIALQLTRDDDERARFSRDLTLAACIAFLLCGAMCPPWKLGTPALDQARAWERYAAI